MKPPSFQQSSQIGLLEAVALKATHLAERYMPDAFIFALLATVITAAAVLAFDASIRSSPLALVELWGKGFWTLIPFTLQMAMIIIGGYVLASSRPIFRLIKKLASLPRDGKTAVGMVALLAMLTSLLNWGFSLIFSAILAKEVARRCPSADYRALGASAFLGLGTVWAQGLSGSAALQMASPSSMPKALAEQLGRTIPLTETIFRWQSLTCVVIEVLVVTLLVTSQAPGSARARSAEDLHIDLGPKEPPPLPPPAVPGERLEHSALVMLPFILLGAAYLVNSIAVKAHSLEGALNALDFNTINLFLLVLGAALHRTPAALMRAVKDATPAVSSVLLQFPFYAGIFGMMTGSALSATIAAFFVSASSAVLYPAFIVTYSMVLGLFVPSGGSKWVIEAPYVLEAARTLGVSEGWMVVTYDLGEALANLMQPFWMLPVLALLGLRARDIMGYTWLVAAVLFPLVVLLVTILRPV